MPYQGDVCSPSLYLSLSLSARVYRFAINLLLGIVGGHTTEMDALERHGPRQLTCRPCWSHHQQGDDELRGV